MDPTKHDLALAYVLGELTDEMAAQVELSAKSDAELRQAIRELEEGIAAGVRALPERSAPLGYRAIEAQLDRSAAAKPAADRVSPPFRWAALGGIAALLVAGVSIGGYEWLRTRNESAIFVAELGAGRVDVRPLRLATPANNRDGRFIQLASLAERMWDDPQSEPEYGNGGGYAVFDPSTRQGFIAVREIPALQRQQRYHLWYVDRDSGKLHDAGALPLDRATRGMFFFSVPATAAAQSGEPSFFLTVEDANAVDSGDRPQGKVVLGKPI
jgi:hypothetical protein